MSAQTVEPIDPDDFHRMYPDPLAEIRGTATCLPAVAFRILGISITKGRQMIADDTFPARVLKIGVRYRVVTADLVALFEGPYRTDQTQ